MCKAAQLPGQTIGAIEVPFRGRTFKVAGDRTIDPWTVTIINDEDFKYRNAFESWTELIAKLDTNIGATSPDAYMRNAKVYQLGRGSRASSTNNTGSANAVLKQYEFMIFSQLQCLQLICHMIVQMQLKNLQLNSKFKVSL
jgi:hypothetical protein